MNDSYGDPFDVALAYWEDAKSKLHLLLELTEDADDLCIGRQAVRELDKLIMIQTYRHCYGIDLDDATAARFLDAE